MKQKWSHKENMNIIATSWIKPTEVHVCDSVHIYYFLKQLLYEPLVI